MEREIVVNKLVRREGPYVKREAWTAQEDKLLKAYITLHGEGKWKNVPKQTGLKRCGKACRLRWMNYLRPDIKRGNITEDEQDLILRLHRLLGNRWSLIAGRLPGRTANEIKNYWNTNLGKKEQAQKQYSKYSIKQFCQNGKRAIIDHEKEEVSWHDEDVEEEASPSILTIDDSDFVTEDSVPMDHSQSTDQPNLDDDAFDFDFDFGDVACLEFLDLDFTQLPECHVFNVNNGSTTDCTGANGDEAYRHICETPKPNCSGETETIWNTDNACFQTTSSYSDLLVPWCDFLDSEDPCM